MSKTLQKIAYARLVVPYDIIDYIVDIDDESQTYIRSPQAVYTMEKEGVSGFVPYSASQNKNTKQPQYFKTERGTGQGDVSSPLTWTSVMDILLTALNYSGPDENLFS